MLVSVLPVLVLAAAVNGQAAPTAKPCCFNSQFTAVTATNVGKNVDGKETAQQILSTVVYDFTNKKMLMGMNISDLGTNQDTYYTVFQDNNAHQQYVTLADGSCFIQPWNEPMESPCIPDDAVFQGELTMNSGNGSLVKANAWRYLQRGADIRMVVSQDTCTPLIRSLAGPQYGENQLQTVMYFNVQPTVDPALLKAPTGCKPQPTLGKQCCASRQFTGSVQLTVAKKLNGTGHVSKGTERYVYDADAQMIYTDSDTTLDTGARQKYRILQNYKTMKMNVMGEGFCFVQDFNDTMLPPCVPDDAMFMGSHWIGSGDAALKANTFEVKRDNYNLTMIVAADTCTPISQVQSGHVYGEEQQRTILFYDFIPTISDEDRKLFTLPANCDTVLPTAPGKDQMNGASGAPLVG